ncbi:glycosyltransferase family 2 protein [Candidatus Bathyarchaeota archaeon]|nr:glycosyltransferase family 2 protein [Candidatus Bathyarchaeota archaeon]
MMSAILYLFYALLIILTLRVLSQLCLSVAYNFKRKNRELKTFPRISLIVPAYNEKKTIRSCVESLQALNYPNYEVVVVDDGSTDHTLEEISHNKGIKIIHQENQGKPKALNNGIKASTSEIIVTVDADTTLDKNALGKIAERFASDGRLGAVAGNVKVNPERKLMNAVQSAEYATGINLIRKGQSVLGCVMIVPGPIAALKREAVEKVGCFSDDTFAEDFDITVKILKAGYRVEYEEKSLAYTDAPKNTEDLIKQRRRWHRGMIQVLDKHKDMYLNRKYGLSGVFGIPNLWLDAFSPFLNIGFLLFTAIMWALTGEFSSSIYGIVIFLFVGLAMGVIGLSLEPKPEKRNYVVLPLLLFFNVFLDGIRIMSTVEDVINIVMEWEKPKR